VLGVCPICFEPTGALTDGARMGAALLAAVLLVVLAGLGRFGWRLMRAGVQDASQVVPGEHPSTAPPREAP
jgi:hypothetical protein